MGNELKKHTQTSNLKKKLIIYFGIPHKADISNQHHPRTLSLSQFCCTSKQHPYKRH